MISIKTTKQYKCGFSLVELMAVVAIIAVLASLTLPRYRGFVARSRMGEAKVNLLHIASLQALYRSENAEFYAGLEVGNVNGTTQCDATVQGTELRNELGFQPDDCSHLRYGYTTTGGASDFGGTAHHDGSPADKNIYPKCAGGGTGHDTWTISKGTKPQHSVNVMTDCE
ncbi:MAG: prepilin-type N-terminal cleavage/methylation domain-containing protein [Pseudomonadota bacterium]|nr:prepilin-type N-terminal cleavage/methylation domain-containing protein [Pseudomonadota bacterium]